MTQTEKLDAIQHQHEIIMANEAKLQQTDYKALKHADGVISDEDYAEVKSIRQSYRDAINAAQEEIDRLDAVELDDPTHIDTESYE